MAHPATFTNITTQTTTVLVGGQANATVTADTVNGSDTLLNISDPSFFTNAPGGLPIFLTGTNITTGTFITGVNAPMLLFQFTATTANASPTLNTPLYPGNYGQAPSSPMFCTGTNIPAGTTISGVGGPTPTLSQNATGAGTTLVKVWSFNPAGASAKLSAVATGSATGTTFTLFSSCPSVLYGIDLNTPVATSVITVFDSPVAGGSIIGKITIPATPVMPSQWLKYPEGLRLKFGLTVLTATANSDLTVAYN